MSDDTESLNLTSRFHAKNQRTILKGFIAVITRIITFSIHMALKLLLIFKLQECKRVLAQNSKLRNSHQEFMKHSPFRPLISTIAFAVVALASPLLSTNAHAALINGGFEDGAVIILPGAGGTAVGGSSTSTIYGDLNGWDTGGVNGFVVATNDQTYFPLGGPGPHGGSLSAVFTASGAPYDGFISQVTATVAGQWYTVGYWASTQGSPAPGPADNLLTINWGGAATNGGAAVTGGYNYLPTSIVVPTGWTHYQFDVLSTGNDRLSFTAGGAAGQEIILDDMTLVEAVPEVSSFGMLTGLGLLAFGTAARIRRRSLATA